MTHLPDPVYPEDIAANPLWFGNITDNYYECTDGLKSCPNEKHYHPNINRYLQKLMKEVGK